MINTIRQGKRVNLLPFLILIGFVIIVKEPFDDSKLFSNAMVFMSIENLKIIFNDSILLKHKYMML